MLLKGEVEFLQLLRDRGGIAAVGGFRSDDVRADFLCERG
jgi:hypothetical protein